MAHERYQNFPEEEKNLESLRTLFHKCNMMLHPDAI